MTPAPPQAQRAGKVTLVGTPIGNLGDLSPRAVEALRSADVIFCEDTRRTRKLLSAAGIPAPRLTAMHKHNEAAAAAAALDLARQGSRVAVVSDAGMPGVSDPGALVVRRAAEERVPLEVVPGPSAILAALVVSGMPTDRFCFEGFLPRQGPDRRNRVNSVAHEERTVVLFEAPHRVRRTIDDLTAVCGPDRPIAIARELTKIHEEIWRGTLAEAKEWVSAHDPRGEWVLVLGSNPADEHEAADDDTIARAISEALAGGSDRRGAIAQVARDLKVPKREVYRIEVERRQGI